MMNFCTLFDSYYIHKGIALYLSLEKTCTNFTLYVVALDDEAYTKLVSLHFSSMVVEKLTDFETQDLLAVKSTRSRVEYIWTCGPSITYQFLIKYNLDSITYLDSDLYFMNSPQIIFDEIGNRSIAITEHNSVDIPKQGRFCVQFMYFKHDEEGCEALTWWRDKCIEWCYAKFEDGKYGDQKYIDEFPKRYKSLCIVNNRGVGIAPWNMNRYQYKNNSLIFEEKNYPFVFFHMHAISVDVVCKTLEIKCFNGTMTDTIKELFYLPYATLMKQIFEIYLERASDKIVIIKRPKYKILASKIKQVFRDNKIVRYIYYDVLKTKYEGYENKKLTDKKLS